MCGGHHSCLHSVGKSSCLATLGARKRRGKCFFATRLKSFQGCPIRDTGKDGIWQRLGISKKGARHSCGQTGTQQHQAEVAGRCQGNPRNKVPLLSRRLFFPPLLCFLIVTKGTQ
ncbi:hypothetical protein CapIbe_010437 [Capra ibex]